MLKASQLAICSVSHGQPWGFSERPTPIPRKTHARDQGVS